MPPADASRRELRRSHHQDLSRSQLLDAAEEIFGTKGFHEATLREVAERAEFSVGSVYSFFENKDDLYLHVFLRRGESFIDGIREIVAAGHEPLDAVRRIVEFEVGWFRAHPHFARLYLRSASLVRTVRGAGIDTFTEVTELQRGVLEAGQADGTIRRLDATALFAVLSGIVTAFVSVDPVVRSGAAETAAQLPVEQLAELVLAALRAPSNSRAAIGARH
jgi:TetR/AcrR family transcriptional regulator